MKEICFTGDFLAVFLLLFHLSCAVKLDNRGGYGIVIAPEENTPQPNDTSVYLRNIKKIFQDFSLHLYKSTKQKFYIESVDLIIPESWKDIDTFEFATTQSYRTADIRIALESDSPRVENPNACGTAGNFIELPSTFFYQPVHGKYGPPGKALVNLWARYRFGVWEEHGYPENFQFPYVYQKPSLNPVWSVTGCSNTELEGKFLNRYGGNCSMDENGKPEKDCKFYPYSNNTAISSILHFSWLNSVTEFCDLRTHNYAAPNRQNFLCGHRSAWDIIKETADFKRANGRLVEAVPDCKLNIFKESQKPLFYLLIDNGRSSYPVEIIKEIMITMGNLYDDLENIASLGSFPNINPRSNTYVAENVPWTNSSTSKEKFKNALEYLTSNDIVVRDFGAAILEVVEQIKLRNHKAGAVIVVVKRGVGVNTFDRMAYEQEVIASLQEQTNIKLLAVELQENERSPYANLNNIVKTTEGEYLLITDKMNTARKLAPFLAKVKELLKSPIISSRKFLTITKQFVNANEKEVEIPVVDEGFALLQLHITTSSLVRTSDIELKQLVGEETLFDVTENKEWNEKVDASRRTVHTFTLHKPPKDSVWSIRYSCPSDCDIKECTGFLVVYGVLEDSTKRSEGDAVFVTVSTSADDGVVDMSRQEPKPVPFSVYAKVEINGHPVLNLQDVQAIIRLSDNSKSWRIPLLDNGNGNPDVSFGDGVYSNVFTPSEDGFYRISVFVGYYNHTYVHKNEASGIGRLLPINQDQIGCYNSADKNCRPAKPTGPFIKISDLPGRIAIENCATFRPGRPMKITDFEVTVLPNFNVVFSFTSPKLLGSDNSPQEFQIFMAPSANNYLGTTEQTKLLVIQIGQKSGTRLQIPYYTLQTALPYYTVEAIYDNMRSGPSNIVGVNTGIPSSALLKLTTYEKSSYLSIPYAPLSTNSSSTDGNSSLATEYSIITKSANSKLTVVQLAYIIIALSVVGVLTTVVVVVLWKKRKGKQLRLRFEQTETRC